MNPDNFPIRCVWQLGYPLRACGEPAVVALCGASSCPCGDYNKDGWPACAEHAAMQPVGFVNRQLGAVCIVCGTLDPQYTIDRHRPLNEGDLPDAERDPDSGAGDRAQQTDGTMPPVRVQPRQQGSGVGAPTDPASQG